MGQSRGRYFGGVIHVTQDSDFVWGVIDVALKLFPSVLNFSFAPIERVQVLF